MRYKRFLTGYFRSLSDIAKKPGLVISEDETLMVVNEDGELEELLSGSLPLTLDPVQDGLTGRTFSTLGTIEAEVVWDYDGDQVLSVAITGYLPNTRLIFASNDELSSNPSGYTDDNGDLTLTKSNVGFDTGGPGFNTHIHTQTGLFGDVPTIRNLAVGTPYNATESYRLGVFSSYVAADAENEPVGNETVTRGSSSFYAGDKSATPFRVFAADGQNVSLIEIFAADGTYLFTMSSDGTPSFHGAGVPAIPATPTAQQVTDALVALGLVTQVS